MPAKLKSFILTALLFTLVLGFTTHAQPSDTTVKKTKNTKALKKERSLSDLEGKWYLQPVLESDTATGHIPELQFDTRQGRMSGNTGCNRMSGDFTATDSTLHFSDKIITTRMFCAGYNETAFIQNLIRIDSYKFKKGWLILTADGVEISRWSREKPQPKNTGKA